MNSTALLEREARDSFDRGDFSKALSIYSRAIGRVSTVSLLDRRAACHERLNDLPSALKDAKACIKLAREDPTGYLRAGKILNKMDKASVALEIYEHALKTVKHAGKSFELLKKTHGQLLAKLSPRTSVDPLTVLPRELAIAVIEQLDFRERMVVRRVSKQWDLFIRSEPLFWQHLDLRCAKKKVRSAFISKAINTARRHITKATLHRLFDFHKSLAALARHCSLTSLILDVEGIHDLELFECLRPILAGLRELRIRGHMHINGNAVNMILYSCRQLEVLEINNNHNPKCLMSSRLTSVTYLINNDSALPWQPYSKLFETVESLTVLEIDRPSAKSFGTMDLTNFAQLRHLELNLQKTSGLQRTPLPPSLQTLTLSNQIETVNAPQPQQSNQLSVSFLPNIEELNIGIPKIKLSDIAAFVSGAGFELDAESTTMSTSTQFSELKTLSVKEMSFQEEDWSLFESPRLSRLRELAITDQLEFADAHLQRICNHLKTLRKLDVSRTSVTGVGVKAVVLLGTVKVLILNGCVLGRDAVDWARTQGLSVEFRTDTSVYKDGTRKVRYE